MGRNDKQCLDGDRVFGIKGSRVYTVKYLWPMSRELKDHILQRNCRLEGWFKLQEVAELPRQNYS